MFLFFEVEGEIKAKGRRILRILLSKTLHLSLNKFFLGKSEYERPQQYC